MPNLADHSHHEVIVIETWDVWLRFVAEGAAAQEARAERVGDTLAARQTR